MATAKKDQNHLSLVYDDPDYATLKLAAAIDGAANLKSWATRTLLHRARQTVSDFKAQATPIEEPK